MATGVVDTRLRRAARRRGFAIVKSRQRAVVETRGGFMILDAAGQIIAGGVPVAFSLRADEVEQFLMKGVK